MRPRSRGETLTIHVPVLLIGGATASGKSDLALRFAAHTGAVVINADAQQLYRDLPILTAQPGPDARRRAEHQLYGVLPPEAETSAGAWLAWLQPILAQAEANRRPLCIVGGTGLYLKALLAGLAPVPPIPEPIRQRLRADPRPTAALYAELTVRDPAMAAKLRPSDRQRIVRALEVVLATGKSLLMLQQQTRPAFAFRGPMRCLALLPPREALRARIAHRFAAMLEAGVLDEVAALAARVPQLEALPIARIHGLRELLRAIRGEWSIARAAERTIAVTRQYAKRQATFFRHQLTGFEIIPAFADELHALSDGLARELAGPLSPMGFRR